jgi:simple sugar transport system permease protein
VPAPGTGSTDAPGVTCGRRRGAAAADAIGSASTGCATVRLVGGLLAACRATITLHPARLVRRLTVNGRGWIAIGLVIFAQWSPFRAAIGAFLFGFIWHLTLGLQLPDTILGFGNPFHEYHPNTFFLDMLPYALVLVALVIGSREAMRKRIGAPAALGIPYVRGERGR